MKLVGIVVLVTSFNCFAQNMISIPVNSLFFGETAHFANATLSDNRSRLTIGNASSLGAFKNIRQFYASGLFVQKKKDNRHFGVTLLRKERGELISESYVKGFYAVRVPIRQDFSAAFGAHFGLVLLSLGGANGAPGGTDASITGDLSVSLKGPKWTVGLSGNNLNAPGLRPINEETKIPRMFGLYTEIQCLEKLRWKSDALSQIWVFQDQIDVTLNWLNTFYKQFAVGVLVGNSRLGLTAGISNYKLGTISSSLYLGYQLRGVTRITRNFTPFQIHFDLTRSN